MLAPVLAALAVGVWLALGVPGWQAWPLWVGLAAVCAVGAGWAHRADQRQVAGGWGQVRSALIAVTAVLAGLGLLGAHTAAAIDRPMVRAETGALELEGWVLASYRADGRERLVLRVAAIGGMAPPDWPARIRLSQPDLSDPTASPTTPGRGVRCRAILHPPGGASAPGQSDYARRAFFEGPGAVGFTLGRCRPAALGPPPGAWARGELALAEWRRALAARAVSAAPGAGGELAGAMISGDRGVLSPATDDALRAAGLSHLVAVSGMNLMLVMGLAFVLATGALRLIPGVAGRWPVRVLGAVASLAAGLAYGVLSGMSVPAQRALIMGAVFWSGHLLDRQGLSPRSLATALWVQLALAPHHVLEPGFQMSYAATAALILVFAPAERAGPVPSALGKARRWTGQMIATSVAAGAATAPIAAAHFQSVATLSLLANLAAMPVVSLLATPATGLAAILGLVGLGDVGLWALGHSFDPVIAVAQAVAAQPQPLREVGPDPSALALGGLLALAVLLAAKGIGTRMVALSAAGACGIACLSAPVPTAILTADGGAYLHTGPGTWLQVRRGEGLPPVPMAASVTRCARACQRQPEHATTDLTLRRPAQATPPADDGWELTQPADTTTTAPVAPTGCASLSAPGLRLSAELLARCGGALVYGTPAGLRVRFAPHIIREAPWRRPPRARTDPQS